MSIMMLKMKRWTNANFVFWPSTINSLKSYRFLLLRLINLLLFGIMNRGYSSQVFKFPRHNWNPITAPGPRLQLFSQLFPCPFILIR